SDGALRSLYENFIEVLRDKKCASHLPGKYKPSWEVSSYASIMQRAYAQHSKQNNLYHYHIGYRAYRPGRDPVYPGMVSEGIAHIRRLPAASGVEPHASLQVDETHPSPFTVPLDISIDYRSAAS